MKSYKIITGWVSNIESQINKYAEDGWIVKSFSFAFEGEDNSNETAVALMEYNEEGDELMELQSINEKLEELLNKLPTQNHDLDHVVEKLKSIHAELETIEYNTRQ